MNLQAEGAARGHLRAAAARVDRVEPLRQRKLRLDRVRRFVPASHLQPETLEAERPRPVNLRVVVLGPEAVPCLATVAGLTQNGSRAAVGRPPHTGNARMDRFREGAAALRLVGSSIPWSGVSWSGLGGPAIRFVKR